MRPSRKGAGADVTTPQGAPALGLSFSYPGTWTVTGFIGSAPYYLYQSTNGGASWTEVASNFGSAPLHITFVPSAGRYFAANNPSQPYPTTATSNVVAL